MTGRAAIQRSFWRIVSRKPSPYDEGRVGATCCDFLVQARPIKRFANVDSARLCSGSIEGPGLRTGARWDETAHALGKGEGLRE